MQTYLIVQCRQGVSHQASLTEVFQVIARWLALVSRLKPKAAKLKPLEDGEELSSQDTLGFLTPEVRCEM